MDMNDNNPGVSPKVNRTGRKIGGFFSRNLRNILLLMFVILLVFYVLNSSVINSPNSIGFFGSRVEVDLNGDGIVEYYEKKGIFNEFLGGLDALGQGGRKALDKFSTWLDVSSGNVSLVLKGLPGVNAYDRYILFKDIERLNGDKFSVILAYQDEYNIDKLEGIDLIWCSISEVYEIMPITYGVKQWAFYDYNRENWLFSIDMKEMNLSLPDGFWVDKNWVELSYEEVLSYFSP